MSDNLTVALVGNPNTGKTSLFNSLTGLSLHCGNWPGKTVEKKEGCLVWNNKRFNFIDLPGTYGISPYSEEEKISNNYLKSGGADVVVQIIDASALERNLIMTYEILSLDKKLIIALNFNEEAKKHGYSIDVQKISEKLQVPIIKIEANKGKNKKELLNQIINISQKNFEKPNYLEKLLTKGEKQTDVVKAMDFFKQNISPFYREASLRHKIQFSDRILMNRYTAFPFFLLVMYLVFKIIFTVSGPIVEIVSELFDKLSLLVPTSLPDYIHSFVSNGLIGGIGTVLSFTPLIFFLFVMIAIIEDSGYLSRAVILTDKFFEKFGITGRSFIPMILGFGCNVPAILATRTIKNKRERLVGILTNSFISCGARLPVYVLFAGIFFPRNASSVIFFLYVLGVFVNLIASSILTRLIKDHEPKSLIIELPPYRVPLLINVIKHAWYHTKEFIQKASTTILIAVLVIWFLASFPFGVEYGSSMSLIGRIGQFISPIFDPLGFGHWTFSVALIFGAMAKEIVIGTLGTLHGVSASGLSSALPENLTSLGALSFLVFVSLYTPCIAAIAAVKKETGKLKYAIIQPIITTAIAWLVSFLIFQIGRLLV